MDARFFVSESDLTALLTPLPAGGKEKRLPDVGGAIKLFFCAHLVLVTGNAYVPNIDLA